MGNDAGKQKDSRVLNEEEITSLMANTSFTREEILQWHAGFIKDCPKGIANISYFQNLPYCLFYSIRKVR